MVSTYPRNAFKAVEDDIIQRAVKHEKMGLFKRAALKSALFVFSPNFLAHGALATSDACMTFFFLAGVGAWWRHLHDGRARWWWLSALVFGLAWVAKYSAPLLLPMMVLMALARAWTVEPLALFGRRFTTRGGR